MSQIKYTCSFNAAMRHKYREEGKQALGSVCTHRYHYQQQS
jgi:hypothetical protein